MVKINGVYFQICFTGIQPSKTMRKTMRSFEDMVNTYNFAEAFCKTLLGCRYAWYETEVILREFRKTYGVD